MIFPSLNYFYIGGVIAVAGLLGFTKYQSVTIESLESKVQLVELENKNLSDKIRGQNDALRLGEEKFAESQRSLDVASGKNQALTKEYTALRAAWKKIPLPVDCKSSVSELKYRVVELNELWNEGK